MVRYQGQVATFRATVPLGLAVRDLPPVRNFVDELVFRQLTEVGLPPSAVCDDPTFLRRVTIDLAGRLPTPEELDAFLRAANEPATKTKAREAVIDRLLASADYAE